MRSNCIGWSDEPEPTFDEKMKAGAKPNDGIAESMPLQGPYERPWSKQTHKTTRCDDESNT